MKIRIGGVPEHFNFPWYYGIEMGYFDAAGFELEWTDFPGGTGAMSNALQKNELDMALLLTEGAIREICLGANFKIAKAYVETPLIWGIHTSSKNNHADLMHLDKMKYAISRFGSGSHLMAHVHAQTKKIQLDENQMIVVGGITNARKSLDTSESDLFFWEKFMTKPFVDSGELKLLDIFPTPWPCFVMVIENRYYVENKDQIIILCEILNRTVKELVSDTFLASKIADKFHLKLADIEEWLQNTKWNSNFDINRTSMEQVCKSLLSLELVDSQIDINELVHDTVKFTK